MQCIARTDRYNGAFRHIFRQADDELLAKEDFFAAVTCIGISAFAPSKHVLSAQVGSSLASLLVSIWHWAAATWLPTLQHHLHAIVDNFNRFNIVFFECFDAIQDDIAAETVGRYGRLTGFLEPLVYLSNRRAAKNEQGNTIGKTNLTKRRISFDVARQRSAQFYKTHGSANSFAYKLSCMVSLINGISTPAPHAYWYAGCSCVFNPGHKQCIAMSVLHPLQFNTVPSRQWCE